MERLKNFLENVFLWKSPEKFLWRLFFLESTCACGLGLEHFCPWPRECLSSERLSLALASDFFCVLGLEPCVLNFTSAVFLFGAKIGLKITKNVLFCIHFRPMEVAIAPLHATWLRYWAWGITAGGSGVWGTSPQLSDILLSSAF